jgi:hypothetical protein
MMRPRGDVPEVPALEMHRRNNRDIRQVRAAGERVVDDDDVALVHGPDRVDGGSDSAQHRAKMYRNMLRLRHELGLGVKDRAGGVHALLDVRRERGALQHRPHLVGDRLERVAQHFERYRVNRVREQRRIVHAPTSTTRLPTASTWARSPG